MHEMSIAMALLEQLDRLAKENHATRVSEVEVTCGVMQQVVPEALQWAFEAQSAGTLAAGAELRIEEEPLGARCRGCGLEFTPTIESFECPNCGQADAELLAGQDIMLKSVVCETEDEAAPK